MKLHKSGGIIMMELMKYLPIIGIVIGVILLLVILASGYVKAPTDKAFIISGLKREPKVLIGRAGIKIPFFERKDEMILRQVSIDIKTNGYIPTMDFIGVDIDAVAKIRVLTEKDITVDADGNMILGVKDDTKRITKDMVNAAMKNFLNMTEDDIRFALTDSLQGNMREIIGTQTLKNLCNDRKAFGDEVQAKAQKDMNALGIWIESCNIQKIEDENGLITALGQDNMSQIQKDASVAKAQADRDVAIAQAEAAKAANDARVLADTEIAVKQNELEIKKAELKKVADAKKAEADAAYTIQQENSRKEIEVATADANIMRQEKEIELRRKNVEVTEQELEARIKKQAEAEKFAAQQKADADLYKRQKEAEARLFEKQKEAEAKKAEADAAKYQMMQEAEGIRAKGEAEAKAIEAKGIAEAEALDRKAEAMKKMDKAAIAEMYFKALPEVAKQVSAPLANVDKITMYGEGNSAKLTGDIVNTIDQVNSGLSESMGLDLKSILGGMIGAKIVDDDNKK